MTRPTLHRGLRIGALLGGLALPVLPPAAVAAGPAAPGAASRTDATAPAQRDFATPEEAAAALADAARSGNTDALMALFGPEGKGVVFSGDKYADAQSLRRFIEAYDAKHALTPAGQERMTLIVGDNDWPLPIPLVEANGRWHFDTAAGAEELIDRRIGRNELAAIRVSLTYVEAQKAFFDLMKAQTGTGFYAQRLVSTPGHHDGLYWPAAAGAPESPFGPLVDQAQEEGYPGENVSGKPIPYQGYFFRILKEQGPDAPGGKKSYLRKGRLVHGFGLIAWPATYGVSGIMTFIVNQDGVVYQKDLGDKTAGRAARIFSFNPDLSWAHVQVTGQ